MKLAREGIQLFYELSGEGENAFIFIHGAGTNHFFLSEEAKHFSKKGRVLTVDLRGHGQSDKPDQPYTIEGYAEDIAHLCAQVGIQNAIVIGHSMGGNIALQLNHRFPKLVSALILLDTFLLIQEKQSTFLRGRIELLKTDFAKALDQIALSTLATEIYRDKVRKELSKTPQHVWVSSLENMLEWDQKKAQECIHHCSVPVLYIEGPKLVLDLPRFETYYSAALIRGKIVGAGHFFPLEVPEQVNAMIDRFISLYVEKK